MSYLNFKQIRKNNSKKRNISRGIFTGMVACLLAFAVTPAKAFDFDDVDQNVWGNENPYHQTDNYDRNYDRGRNDYLNRDYDRDLSNRLRDIFDPGYNSRTRDDLYRDDYLSRNRYDDEFNPNRRTPSRRYDDRRYRDRDYNNDYNRDYNRDYNNDYRQDYDRIFDRDYDRNYDRDYNQPAPRNNDSQVDTQNKILGRYSNPVVVRFVNNVSTQQAISVYREISQMIDSRHIQPTSYSTRTTRALKNLQIAVSNRTFQQAVGMSSNQQQVYAFQNTLSSAINQNQPRNSSEALNLMYSVMQSGQSQVGLKPSVVATEFIFGAIDTLDKYSAFEPEDVFRQPSASVLDEEIVGIGVEIKPHDKGVRVMKALRGSPAANIGLKGGDLIVGINGRSLAGKSMDEITDMIAGPAGSSLNIAVDRDGRIINPVTITRQRIHIYSVSEYRMVDNQNKVAYIKLDTFSKSSSSEMDQALYAMHQQGMRSLVIDLRGNPGGLLTTAIELSNKFLPTGTIVSTRGRNQQDNSVEYATSQRTWKTPLVVLVDENSASASEIFAAAIQENQRGIVVGRKSYGKGTVQTHFPLQSVSGNVRLTTAKFYSPRGREMAGAGVTPDYRVSRSDDYIVSSQTSDVDVRAAMSIATNPQLRELVNTFLIRQQQQSSELPEDSSKPEETKVVIAKQ